MRTENRLQLIKNKELFISCIVPVFNEESCVEAFFPALIKQLQEITQSFEIIAVDDGSKDGSFEKLLQVSEQYPIKVISFSRNFGKEIAISAGLDHAKGDVAILLDGDFQHPLAVLPTFVKHWGEGYDMVYGIRKNRQSESVLKRNFAGLFYWLMAKITKIEIPSHAGDFRLLDRKVINSLTHFKERSRFMKGLYAWVGFKNIAVPYDVQRRAGGKSGWGFRKLTELAITGITSFSDFPLRVCGFIGFLISVFSLIYAIYIITTTLIYGTDLPGFPTLAAAIMFFGGIQLLSIGIVGEYIARIFTEVKQRPNYIIAMKMGFDD